MKFRFSSMAATALLISGCGGDKSKADMANAHPPLEIRTDVVGVEAFLKPPTAIRSAKWCTFSRSIKPSRLAIGPDDRPTGTGLIAVIEIDSNNWPSWEHAMDSASGIDGYFLTESHAVALLPPEWLASLPLDTLGYGRRLQGKILNPNPIATAPYTGVAAIRRGDHLFLGFRSK